MDLGHVTPFSTKHETYNHITHITWKNKKQHVSPTMAFFYRYYYMTLSTTGPGIFFRRPWLAARHNAATTPWPLRPQRLLMRIQRKMWCFQRNGRELISESWNPKIDFSIFNFQHLPPKNRHLFFFPMFFFFKTVFDTIFWVEFWTGWCWIEAFQHAIFQFVEMEVVKNTQHFGSWGVLFLIGRGLLAYGKGVWRASSREVVRW